MCIWKLSVGAERKLTQWVNFHSAITVMTFRDAAARHLREATKRSIGRDVYALERLVPVIGPKVLLYD